MIVLVLWIGFIPVETFRTNHFYYVLKFPQHFMQSCDKGHFIFF